MPIRPLRLAAVTLAAALTLGACGSDDGDTSAPPAASDKDTALARIDITTLDFTFSTRDLGPVKAGVVPVRFENKGAEPHQINIGRLPDGLSASDLAGADLADVERKLTWVGGANVVDPGMSAEGYAELEPGRYAMVCFIPSPDGKAHVHKGMVREFEVVETDSPVAAPSAVGDITLSDFALKLPEGGIAEKGVYRFVNEGAEAHEMIVLRVKEGKTVADVAAFLQAGLQGVPPFTFAGGAGVIAAGSTGYATLDLAPGDYVALCFVTGEHTGQPHAAMGMVAPFTVS